MGWLSIFRAVTVRLLFTCHGLISVWRLYVVTSDARYWYLAAALVLLLLEMAITVVKRSGREWKWWVPERIMLRQFYYIESRRSICCFHWMSIYNHSMDPLITVLPRVYWQLFFYGHIHNFVWGSSYNCSSRDLFIAVLIGQVSLYNCVMKLHVFLLGAYL